MGDLIGVGKALSEPASKIIDSINAGVGGLYKPRAIRKNAKAKAEEIAIISKVIRENSDISITYKNGEISMDNYELLERTKERIISQEINRQQNLEAIVDVACEIAENLPYVSSAPVDKDWINRFINYAQDISNEVIQILWSRILAGEVCKPGSFSLRTLHVLRNISQIEAELFCKLVPLIFKTNEDTFLYSNNHLYKKYNVSYDDLLLLEECGLISLNSFVIIDCDVSTTQTKTIFNKNKVAIFQGLTDEVQKVNIYIHALTKVGKELMQIVIEKSNNDFFDEAMKDIYESNKQKANIKIFNITKIENDIFEHEIVPITEYRSIN